MIVPNLFRFGIRKDSPAFVIAVLVLGAALAVGGSVFATTIGTNVTVTGALTVNGNSTLGDAAADVNLFTGTLQASTTALFTSGFTTYGNWTVDQSATTTVTFNQAGINFDAGTFVIDPNANRVGIGTTTPGSFLSVHSIGNFVVGATSTIYTPLTFTSFSATSTSATSTLSTGGFQIGTDQFTVQQGSGRIGVGTTTPGSLVGIQGVANLVSGATSTVYSTLSVPNLSATSTSATTTISTGGFRVGNDALVVQQSATTSIGVGTSTSPSHQFAVSGNVLIGAGANGTSTLTINSSGTRIGSCIELRAADGELVRIYATTSSLVGTYTNAGLAMPGRGLVVEAGGCR